MFRPGRLLSHAQEIQLVDCEGIMSKKKKEPDDKVKFIAGAIGGGCGALVAGPLGAAVGAGITHFFVALLVDEGF